jgi:hypothetical protein
MSNQEKSKSFEQFPRQDLPFRFSRRELFGLLPAELRVSKEESQGIPGFSLSSLGSAPDDYLAQIIPVMVPDCRISVADGWVWGQLPNAPQPEKLFQAETAVIHAFNQFNGRNDLGAASYRLAHEMDWDEKRAFALVRGLFLYLVQRRVCQPK